MNDGIFHAVEDRSYFELREEFRRANHERILAMLSEKEIPVGPLRYRYKTDSQTHLMEEMYGPQDFGLESVPKHLIERLYEKAEEIETFEAMIAPENEGADWDGPAASPIQGMTETEQIAYVDQAIAASKRD
jgi:hypothetical protein